VPGDVAAGVGPGHRKGDRLEGRDRDVDPVAHAPAAQELVDEEHRLEGSRRALERRTQKGDEHPAGVDVLERSADGRQRRGVVQVVGPGTGQELDVLAP
jgi:hypothetical protein